MPALKPGQRRCGWVRGSTRLAEDIFVVVFALAIFDAGRFVRMDLVGGILFCVQRPDFGTIQHLCDGPIQIPDVDVAIGTATVNVLLARSLGRRKVASDQRLQNGMATICHDRAILRMRLVARLAIRHVPIVPIPQTVVKVRHAVELGRRVHHAQVPQPTRLVFAVRNAVAPITLGRNVGDAFRVSHEHAGRFAARERTTVPYFYKRVVGARDEDIRGRSVGKGNRIDVVRMALHAKDTASSFNVVDIDVAKVSAGDDLARVARKAN